MSFKDKLTQYYAKKYLKKYGDRLTQVQGNVVSTKISVKSILWVFNKLTVTLLVRPDKSKTVVQCIYVKNRWFKKPDFINISQGNLLLVQGLKGEKPKKGKKAKENREKVTILNIRNMTTKMDLLPMENAPKIQRQIQRR